MNNHNNVRGEDMLRDCERETLWDRQARLGEKRVLNYERKCTVGTQTGDIDVTLKANSNGIVYWCSHWELIGLLKTLGVVRSVSGPWNHQDFYLTNL